MIIMTGATLCPLCVKKGLITGHKQIRLDLTQKLLAFARESGLIRQEDQITYVTFMALLGEGLTSDPVWQAAINDALDKQTSLVESVQTHLHEQLR
ncbi:hypothetical protein PUR31_24155 [Pseudomonas mosselii]|uniref:hypothetical protein n=1 Tax=unclassified Pseudomonas TaxID=196821 RepID=UPI0020C3A7A6|nr:MULTISPECIES: hypothetical protein [unclassified Pseudomonas]MCP8636476.1 hypothetical protein [Pseudomonas sp. DVZ6]MDD7787208.1 hypothetical protein [Pseudomonas sp. DVZ24]